MNPGLPPELVAFAQLLDAQPIPIQVIFQYCLAMVMVETGKAQITQTVPSDNGVIYTFQTINEDVFSLTKPALSEEIELAMMKRIREILRDEGWE